MNSMYGEHGFKVSHLRIKFPGNFLFCFCFPRVKTIRLGEKLSALISHNPIQAPKILFESLITEAYIPVRYSSIYNFFNHKSENPIQPFFLHVSINRTSKTKKNKTTHSSNLTEKLLKECVN